MIVALGFVITAGLLYMENNYHLSEIMIDNLQKGVEEYMHIMLWNQQHNNPYILNAFGEGY